MLSIYGQVEFLALGDNITMNLWTCYQSYKLYAVASAISSISERLQCYAFLHTARPDAQKVVQTMRLEENKQDKIKRLINAFQKYWEGKANITVVSR